MESGSAKARLAVRYLIAIAANDIDQAGMLIDEKIPEGWITSRLGDETFRAVGDGRFWGRLSRSGKSDIIVRGSVKAEIGLPCARCLRDTVNPIRSEISLLLKFRPGSTDFSRIGERWPSRERRPPGHRSAEYEFSSEEADVDEYDGEVVILDDFVREAILLELPNFPLCSESCTGICPELEDAVRGKGRVSEGSGVFEGSLSEGNVSESSASGGSFFGTSTVDGQGDRRRPAATPAFSHTGLDSNTGKGADVGMSLGSLSKAGSTGRVNPFEALIHLRPTLARGREADGAPEEPTAVPTIPRAPAERSRRKELKAASKATKKNDKKITSTHAAPARRASAKKSARAGNRTKRR